LRGDSLMEINREASRSTDSPGRQLGPSELS
jgi:hypothetical protein